MLIQLWSMLRLIDNTNSLSNWFLIFVDGLINKERGSSLISPPRHPLQAMNTVTHIQPLSAGRIEQLKHQGFGSPSTTLDGFSSSPSRRESVSSSNSCSSTPGRNSINHLNTSLSSPICRSPALDRLFKKITKKNGKGETPLHTAAIRGKHTVKSSHKKLPRRLAFMRNPLSRYHYSLYTHNHL